MNLDPKALNDPYYDATPRVSARLNMRVPDACPENVLISSFGARRKGNYTPYPLWAVNFVEDKD